MSPLEPPWRSLIQAHTTWSRTGRSIDEFVAHVQERGIVSDDPSGRLSAAVTALRPRGVRTGPSDAMWSELVDIAESAPTNPIDVAVAFGCGWRRTTTSASASNDPWLSRWEPAVMALIAIVRASVQVSGRLLEATLPQFSLTRDDLQELPAVFALSLLGACDCEHHVRSCTKRACGRDCCFPDHDLERWDPAVCHLRPFIDQAVRGTALDVVRGGAFAESMLYRTLEREGRVLRRRAEFKRCPTCATLYDDDECPKPRCAGAEGRSVVRVARANWLILPAQEGGSWHELVRSTCGNNDCGSLYPIRYRLTTRITDDPCPVCGWKPPPGVTPTTITVWGRVE